MADQKCPHNEFMSTVRVARIMDMPHADGTQFMAEFQVTCSQCGEPFRFTVQPLIHPNLDGLVLHAIMEPSTRRPIAPETPAPYTPGVH